MTKPGGESFPLDGKRWFHAATGQPWTERRFHRGRVVLAMEGRVGHEVRLYRPEDDPGTGGAVLGPPTWRPVVDSCSSCPDIGGTAEIDLCPDSRSPCGHHCNHSWSHDVCDWCGTEWGEEGAKSPASRAPETLDEHLADRAIASLLAYDALAGHGARSWPGALEAWRRWRE